MREIPFAKPVLDGAEIEQVVEVINSGWIVQGRKVTNFENYFSDWLEAPGACAVSSCTTALHLALLGAGVSPGDIVITVSYSFIATANVIRYYSAEPYFVDIEEDTLNMSPTDLETKLKSEFEFRDGSYWLSNSKQLSKSPSPLSRLKEPIGRLAAILVVHQAGVPADLRSILRLASEYRVPVVEDAACALGSEISMDGGKSWEKVGKPHGIAACFSFHPRKIITTGEGGIITATGDVLEYARQLGNHGTSVTAWNRESGNEILRESYSDVGFNYRMTDLQAAVGLAQMSKLEEILNKRREVAAWYEEELDGSSRIKPPVSPENTRVNNQSYICTLSDPDILGTLMKTLKNSGIYTRTGILNIHRQMPYQELWGDVTLPVSEASERNRLMLPFYPEIARDDVKRISQAIDRV